MIMKSSLGLMGINLTCNSDCHTVMFLTKQPSTQNRVCVVFTLSMRGSLPVLFEKP